MIDRFCVNDGSLKQKVFLWLKIQELMSIFDRSRWAMGCCGIVRYDIVVSFYSHTHHSFCIPTPVHPSFASGVNKLAGTKSRMRGEKEKARKDSSSRVRGGVAEEDEEEGELEAAC